MDAVITSASLTKYFARHCAVNQLTFAVPRGSVTAFLGRNGSGKSTTLRMLLGLLEPTRGSSTVLGHDSRNLPPSLRANIGYLAEGHPLIKWMTVQQAAKFQSAFYAKWNQKIFDATIDHFNLPAKTIAGHLSRGQRAGLALALTLAPEPDLLILDDPALGLDPVARRALLESILYITRNPARTVLLSSHLLDDIERIADYLLILDRSVLKAACTLDEFRSRIVTYQLTLPQNRARSVSKEPPQNRARNVSKGPPAILPEIPGLLDALHIQNTLRLIIANPPPDIATHLAALNPSEIQTLPTNFQDAVTAYMSDHRARSVFLDSVADGIFAGVGDLSVKHGI